MYLNKHALGGALQIAEKYICVEKDGSIISANQQALYISEPVTCELPFGDAGMLKERIVLPVASCLELYKMIGKDTLFGGTFENFCLTDGVDGIACQISNGRNENTFKMRKVSVDFVDGFELMKDAWTSRNKIITISKNYNKVICLNRDRLTKVLTGLNSACKYQGEFSPVFEYRCSQNRVIWRSINELTNQRIWILFTDAGNQAGLKMNKWESKNMGIGTTYI